MTKELSITHFPVGNGDTSLIRLKDGTTIIIDCHICEDGPYDVTSHLLESLNYEDENSSHSCLRFNSSAQ